MPVGTYEDYAKRLRKMKPNVYINGKKVDRSGDWINGGMYVMKQTYDYANDPEYQDVCTATSHSPETKSIASRMFTGRRKTCSTSR